METPVIFRKFKDEILAVFPYDVERSGSCTCYAHIGQHSSCDYDHVINTSKLAKEEDFKDLLSELKSIGYEVKIIKKRNYNKYLDAYHKIR